MGTDGLTVAGLCNAFLTHKRHLLDIREIVERSFRDYYSTCGRLVEVFGKNRLVNDLVPSDFAYLRKDITKTRGAVSTGNEINRIRGVFKHAYDEGLIDHPIRYGPGFQKPSAKVLRIARSKNGRRDFQRDELLAILDSASMPMRAMILLGTNAGLGNTDVSSLMLKTVRHSITSGWLDYARSKTGVERRIPLWDETRKAMQEAVEHRPEPKDAAHGDLAFLTRCGQPWVRTSGDAVSGEFAKLLSQLGLKKLGVGFCSLRRTFQTQADAARDPVATAAIMGHTDSSMGAVYRQGIDDERLQAVTDHVHNWLFVNSEQE